MPQRSLPIEILAEILSFLDDPSVITLACHLFHDISLPMLYRCVDLSIETSDKGSELRLQLFLRSLLRNAQLRSLVRELKIGQCNQHIIFTKPSIHAAVAPGRALENDFLQAISAGAEDSSVVFPQIELPITPLRRALISYSAELLKVLGLLPLLQKIDWPEAGFLIDSFTFAALGMTTGGIPLGLQSVNSLSLKWTENTDIGYISFEGHNIVPLFHLPALRCLSVENWVGRGPNTKWEPVIVRMLSTTGSSPIRHLSLVKSDIAPPLLSDLLMLLHELHSLKYTMTPARGHFHGCDWRSLHRALRFHAATLTSLEVFSTSFSDDRMDVGPMIGTLGTLRPFSALRDVRLPARALFGARNDGEAS